MYEWSQLKADAIGLKGHRRSLPCCTGGLGYWPSRDKSPLHGELEFGDRETYRFSEICWDLLWLTFSDQCGHHREELPPKVVLGLMAGGVGAEDEVFVYQVEPGNEVVARLTTLRF